MFCFLVKIEGLHCSKREAFFCAYLTGVRALKTSSQMKHYPLIASKLLFADSAYESFRFLEHFQVLNHDAFFFLVIHFLKKGIDI
jgi:hypothetical protein